MKRAAWVGVLLLGLTLSSGSRAYMILHQDSDLSQPELYRPDTSGLPPTPGKPPETITFVIADNVPFPKAVRQAFSQWSVVQGAAVTFVDGGIQHFTGDWTTRVAAPDGFNAVEMVKQGWNLGNTVLGWTSVFSDPLTGEILEADIYLNGQDFTWADLAGAQDHPHSHAYDLQNIVTHEAGHVLGLAHSQVLLATMWPITALGETHKRTLHDDDRDGLRYLYPMAAADYPPPSLWGIKLGSCTFSADDYSSYLILTAGAGSYSFCLFGAGVLDGVSAGLNRDSSPLSPNPVSAVALVSENLVSGALDYTDLASDAYDPTLTNSGLKTGELFQGLFLNVSGNELPVAVATMDKDRVIKGEYRCLVEAILLATMDKDQVLKGKTVTLDGSGSYDPEGAPLTYQWLVIDAPEGAAVSFASPTSVSTTVKLPQSGIYIFDLVVNDGKIDSLADSVIVTALPPPPKSGGGGGGGCALDPEAAPTAAVPLFLPALLVLAGRAWRRNRSARSG